MSMDKQHREKLISRLKELRAEGKSRTDMASSLNGEGIKTPSGIDWTDVLIGAFMTRMGITKTANTSPSTEGKEVFMASKKANNRKATGRIVRATATTTAEQTAPATGNDADLVAIVASVVSSSLTREQKVRAFTALI